MPPYLKQILRSSFAPMGLLVLALAGSVLLPRWYPQGMASIASAPSFLLAVGILLSLAFNRSRFTLMQLTLLIAWLAHEHGWTGHRTIGAWALNGCVLLNFALFGLFRDRSMLSAHGFLRLMILVIECVFGYVLLEHATAGMMVIATWQLLPWGVPSWWVWPQTLLLFSMLAMGAVGIRFFSSLRHIEAGLLGALTAFVFAINHTTDGHWYPLMMATAALILCVAILLDSYHMAYRDELTGIPARRALNQYLLSLGRRYTIAMLDVDHFKKFNDTHGHDVGDQVLKLVAEKIDDVGGGGRGFRYGGEEFTVVFAGKTPKQAEMHLEALREAIANYRMVVRSGSRPKGKEGREHRGEGGGRQTLSVTISIGMAERTDDLRQPDQVIKAADEALYRAKKKGRNCLSQ